MARRLIVVEKNYVISRGIVPFPGYVPQEGEEPLMMTDQVVIRRPDGTSLFWYIGGVEVKTPDRPYEDSLILLTGLLPEQMPVGSEIWTVDRWEYDWLTEIAKEDTTSQDGES